MALKNWWERSFEGGDYLKIRDTKEEWNSAKAEVDFIIKTSEKERGAVLDVQCGFGRHADAFSKKGFDVVGIDISEKFLNLAKEKTSKEIKYIKKDVLHPFDLEKFDLIVNLFTSFGYFSDAQNKKMLENIYESLKDDGVFVLEVPNLMFFKNSAKAHGTKINEDLYQTSYGMIDLKQNLLHFRYVEDSRIKLYSIDELSKLFDTVGLKINSSFGDYMDTSITEKTKKNIFFLTK